MRTLQEKYNAVLEGNFSKEQFRRDAVMQLPNVVSKFNSFEDTATILKNRGMIAEVKKEEVTAYKKPEVDPIDLIAPDLLDDGIKAELEAASIEGTPSEEEYVKAKEKAAKNLAKDPLHYKNAQTMPEMGEKMEKATLKEGREQLLEMLASIIGKAKEYAEKKYPAATEKDINDFIRMHGEDIMKGADLEAEFDNYYDANFNMDEKVVEERLDYDTLTRMEGLVSIKVVDNFIEASQTIIKDLEQEGFEQDEIYEFLIDRLRTQEPISSADVVKELEDSEEDEIEGPDVEDLYQHDPEYLATLKEAVKTLIKKTLQD